MKITKNLKYAEFEWDDELKTFTITEQGGNRVILNKVYSFAFMRFVVRMAQRNWFRKIKEKELNKEEEQSAELVERSWEDPDQIMLDIRDSSSHPNAGVSVPEDYRKTIQQPNLPFQ
jgi:hypothetical protein|tara:strand:- start:290 stop:640 length:351 start_codon:yes stop_codon:yes gene_type:complete